jgi:ketosteroid isomerase-like protein
MTAQEQLSRYFELWMRHDSAAMAELYAADAVMEDPTLVVARRGRAEIERYYAEMYAALEQPVHELLDWAERGKRLWFEWTFGSGGGARPVERYHGVSIQTFRDGLIVHDVAFWNPS